MMRATASTGQPSASVTAITGGQVAGVADPGRATAVVRLPGGEAVPGPPGEPGPAGPTGPAGPAGPAGPPTYASVGPTAPPSPVEGQLWFEPEVTP